MRQPFWIVNSILLLELLASTYFILFMPVKTPAIKSITPVVFQHSQADNITEHDYSSIYLNDLFGTKSQPSELEEEFSVESDNFPLAPELSQPEAPVPFTAQFLEPLPIVLTGIMTFGNNLENIAIILDQVTKEEINYHIGDRVQDAQIINITKHKVELIRNNGQQETLYLYQREAKSDMEKTDTSWDKFIRATGYHQITIDLEQFTEHVKNLGNLIELLDLTTAFQDGENLGCRIGQAGYKSLGNALGFEVGDIVLSIANIPTKSTQDRFEIYQKLTNYNPDHPEYNNNLITVEILRHNQIIKLDYNLANNLEDELATNLRNRLVPAPSTTRSKAEISETEFVLPDHPRDLKINDLKRETQVATSEKSAPAKYTDTLQKMQQHDRQHMLNSNTLKSGGGTHV